MNTIINHFSKISVKTLFWAVFLFCLLLPRIAHASVGSKPVVGSEQNIQPVKYYDYYEGSFAVGINYPGISIQYGVAEREVLELRIQSLQDITVIGPRYYIFLSEKITRLNPYYGFEFDVIPFSGKYSKGTGFAGEVFVGVNEYLSKKIFIGMDIGPAYLYFADQNTHLNVSGLDFVMNFSINYVFK